MRATSREIQAFVCAQQGLPATAATASFSISDLHSTINSSSTHSSNIPKTPLVNCVVLNKHLYPLLSKLALERGGMHGFRHHRVSTLVMAGTPMVVIKRWIGHGSEEMVSPNFMQDELARVPDFASGFGPELAAIDPFDPKAKAAA
jgi:hypothetical protein